MYNSLYVILILIIISDANSSYCLKHLPRHQPSIGHHLLRIEPSINNEKECEYRCSVEQACSMATFNRPLHRCHLFQHNREHSLSKPYRTNRVFSTFDHCSDSLSSSDIEPTRMPNIHCDYDSLLWQRALTSRSITFKSYTLIGISPSPCQELCSAVRYCAGVQYQVRDSHHHRCRLLRSAKPWDLLPSKTWSVFAKRSCHVQIGKKDFFSRDNQLRCNFKYFGQGQHKYDQGIIHTFARTSKNQCQYFCSKMVNCIGVEYIEKRSQCILLSPNFLQNDGSLDMKPQQHHHIYLKTSCSPLKCSSNDQQCGCHQNYCQHGTCLSYQSDGYYYMFCNCNHGFTGHLCEQEIDHV